MPSTRRARPPPAGRTPRVPPRSATAVAARPRSVLDTLGEEPHAHIVCRVCGRIQGLELTELDRHLLTELAGLTPDGWTVERIAYSLAGACQRCRQGPSVP
jgi:Fe2+ or Zn2+ uptake regulation protein